MKTKKQYSRVFLVIVPHRDIRLVLRKYSADLFGENFPGAYLFPQVAPVFALSQPLTNDELKNCARSLRGTCEKIHAKEAVTIAFQDGFALFGPQLDFSPCVFSDSCGFSQKVTGIFSNAILGACLLPAANGKIPALSPPQMSFRAAAVANLYWHFNDQGGSFYSKWKIGKLHWLPKI